MEVRESTSPAAAVQREFSRIASTYAWLTARPAAREARALIRWIELRPKDWVLDAACGPGVLARSLALRSSRVCALDLCPRMIEAARSGRLRSRTSVWYTVGQVERLPYRSGSFNLVTCAYAFANVPQPLEALREFARVVRRGGRIVVVDVVAPEDPGRCAGLNRLEALRSCAPTRILKRSEFVDLFAAAHLRLLACRMGQRQGSLRGWLQLSPAAAHPRQRQRLRRAFLDSISGDQASLRARFVGRELIFRHTVAWFLLRREN